MTLGILSLEAVGWRLSLSIRNTKRQPSGSDTVTTRANTGHVSHVLGVHILLRRTGPASMYLWTALVLWYCSSLPSGSSCFEPHRFGDHLKSQARYVPRNLLINPNLGR